MSWRRHVIDDSSRGADGTRLADANGDDLMDIVTGWEQGGVTRIYLNPGVASVTRRWPSVTVGETVAVEDAVMVDLDRDGSLDVVSCCEGKRKAMSVHWAPDLANYMDASQWVTVDLPASVGLTRWMFSTPMDVDGDGHVDLLAGGKGAGSYLGWWKIPDDARDVARWQWHPIRPMGWLMSLEAADMDGDGDEDILFSDRKGEHRGCFWLENDPQQQPNAWQQHAIAAIGREAMFVQRVDLDTDGLEDLIVATRPKSLLFCKRLDPSGKAWKTREVVVPRGYGDVKSAHAADLDLDGSMEVVFSTERAIDGKIGVGRIVSAGDLFASETSFTPISGVDGVKHDLVKLVDLDQDGDLDVLTCEEVKNLGVIWYENPQRVAAATAP